MGHPNDRTYETDAECDFCGSDKHDLRSHPVGGDAQVCPDCAENFDAAGERYPADDDCRWCGEEPGELCPAMSDDRACEASK